MYRCTKRKAVHQNYDLKIFIKCFVLLCYQWLLNMLFCVIHSRRERNILGISVRGIHNFITV